MRYLVLFEHMKGWSTGFYVESDEAPAVLLARLGREGVVIDRAYTTEYYAPSQIKNLQINKDEPCVT